MRTLSKNKSRLRYLLQTDSVTAREYGDTTQYITVDGVQVPVETGTYDVEQGSLGGSYQLPSGTLYPTSSDYPNTWSSSPSVFFGNISRSNLSGGRSKTQEYGIDLSAYDAVLITDKDLIPLTETSLIWDSSSVVYNDDGTVDVSSADYEVVKVIPSINVSRYILKGLVN